MTEAHVVHPGAHDVFILGLAAHHRGATRACREQLDVLYAPGRPRFLKPLCSVIRGCYLFRQFSRDHKEEGRSSVLPAAIYGSLFTDQDRRQRGKILLRWPLGQQDIKLAGRESGRPLDGFPSRQAAVSRPRPARSSVPRSPRRSLSRPSSTRGQVEEVHADEPLRRHEGAASNVIDCALVLKLMIGNRRALALPPPTRLMSRLSSQCFGGTLGRCNRTGLLSGTCAYMTDRAAGCRYRIRGRRTIPHRVNVHCRPGC